MARTVPFFGTELYGAELVLLAIVASSTDDELSICARGSALGSMSWRMYAKTNVYACLPVGQREV